MAQALRLEQGNVGIVVEAALQLHARRRPLGKPRDVPATFHGMRKSR